jgi:hypothetical protein
MVVLEGGAVSYAQGTPADGGVDPSARLTCTQLLVGSGKDIGQDKPAFGWELEPLEPLVLFLALSLRRKIQDKKVCEQHAMAMRPGILRGYDALCILLRWGQ